MLLRHIDNCQDITLQELNNKAAVLVQTCTAKLNQRKLTVESLLTTKLQVQTCEVKPKETDYVEIQNHC